MLKLKTWIRSLRMGVGNVPCELPKIEMDLDAGDELFLEVRNRNGEITLRVKADVQGAFDASLKKTQKRFRRIMEKSRKEVDPQ